VGVLSIWKVYDLLEGAHMQRREVLTALSEPARDGGVVARGGGKRLGGQASPRGQREQAVGVAQLSQDGVVALGPDHHGGEGVVLRRGPDHRRPADVDVLDHLGIGHAPPGHRALEWIQVHAHQVDVLDALLGGLANVLGIVTHGEQSGIELRMKRLDATVHDLGKAGEVLDRPDRHAGVAQLRGRPARGHDLHAQRHELTSEIDYPALVGNRQQRSTHPHRTRSGDRVGPGDLAVDALRDGTRIHRLAVGRPA
jgi:hypothetical protein